MTLEWILGRCDSLRAEVFLRAGVPHGVDPAEVTLTGTLTGPECSRAITLPVTAKLAVVKGARPPASNDTVVARVILTEPSYWSPEVPSLYQLDATLLAGGREVVRWQRTVGLRPLGVRNRSLWLDGRRYVPRGLITRASDVVVEAFREAAVAAVVPDPDEQFLRRCDAEGVAVVGLLADAHGQPVGATGALEHVARWAWHPSVLMALVPAAVDHQAVVAIATETLRRRGTLLVAREVDGSQPPPESSDGIDALAVSLQPSDVPHPAWRHASPRLPLLAWRRSAEGAMAPPVVAPSRRPCDALQASLAAWRTSAGPEVFVWDWAGFLADGAPQRSP